MPRRRHPAFHHIKPNPQPEHFRSPATPTAAASHRPHSSVNALLSHLRSSQPAPHNRHDDDDDDEADVASRVPRATPSVPPPLQALLGTTAAAPPPPRPRINGPTARARSLVGPPTPASWLRPRRRPSFGPSPSPSSSPRTGEPAGRPRLPDLPLPAPDSLLAHALGRIAQNWRFHRVYDQHFLPLLPPRLKALLLQHLPALSPSSFSLLFSHGADDVTHLDLSAAPLAAIVPQLHKPGLKPDADADADADVGDSWDSADPDHPLPPAAATAGGMRFGALTHLSVAAPRPDEEVAALLALLDAVPGITHLSLAGWRLSDAMLRGVARRTLCLRWLDARGCYGDSGSGSGVDVLARCDAWSTAWRRVATVVLVCGEQDARGLERAVREHRRGAGVGTWLTVSDT